MFPFLFFWTEGGCIVVKLEMDPRKGGIFVQRPRQSAEEDTVRRQETVGAARGAALDQWKKGEAPLRKPY